MAPETGQETVKTQPISEAEIDETIEASFPASDPPSWTLGTDHRTVERKGDGDQDP